MGLGVFAGVEVSTIFVIEPLIRGGAQGKKTSITGEMCPNHQLHELVE